MSEYSYFRAAGLSLAAVETVEMADRQIADICDKLARDCGAERAMWTIRDNRFAIFSFVFADAAQVPAGWVEPPEVNGNGNGTIYRLPPAGSAMHFNVQAECGRATRFYRRNSLEKFFCLDHMPMRDRAAGNYSDRFVRETTWLRPFGGFDFGPKPATQGYARQPQNGICGSNSACRTSDPLQYLKYGADYYIRVPNDDAGQPRWLPPDAMPISLADMLAIDAAVHAPKPAKPGPTP